MTLALAVWKNRISPVFDSSHTLLLVDIKNGMVTNKRIVPLRAGLPLPRVKEVLNLGIQVLICGAISSEFSSMFEAFGISVVPFVAGDADHVIESYLNNTLSGSNFKMPGCGNQRRRRRRGGYL